MRDTLLLVLACIGGTSVILTGVVILWMGGTACVMWYDRLLANREYAAKVDRVSTTWQSRPMPSVRPWTAWTQSTEMHPHRHAVGTYASLNDFLLDVQIEAKMREVRRAGARGESDG